MNSVFKNIRRKFFKEGNYLQYARYALGEILLIVGGILLALYLNNLNEKKNLRQDQVKVLNEIISNLNGSIQAFERTIQTEKNYLLFNKKILEHLEKKLPYDPSLDMAFGTYFWTISTNPVTGAYDHLKEKGMDLIESDSLRQSISFLFESEFTILKEENEFWSNSFQQNISYPYHVQNFRKYFPEDQKSENYEFAKPNNYSELLEDAYFLNINTEIISNRGWNIRSLENLILQMEDLKKLIQLELDRLSK
jgi:hypothetical protein